MKRQTRRIEIRIETHELKVIRFRNNRNPVERETDVSDEAGMRTDQSRMIDVAMVKGRFEGREPARNQENK